MDIQTETERHQCADAAAHCDIFGLTLASSEGVGEMSTADLINGAKAAIRTGENSFHLAAEYLAAAEKRGVSQREMAKEVCKSHSWVNALLKWHAKGCSDTPFGPQARASRQRARAGQSTNQTKPEPAANGGQGDPTTERARAEAAKAQAEAEKAKADAAKAEAEARAAEAKAKVRSGLFGRNTTGKPFPRRSRDILIKTLGMLGSDQPGERANAASLVDQQRRELGMSWDELIVAATVFNTKAA